MSLETWTAFEPHDFHAVSAVAHAKAAGDHAQSAMTGDAKAYMSHLAAAKAHDAAAVAHKTTSRNLPLPINASKPEEGTPIATPHPVAPSPINDARNVLKGAPVFPVKRA